VLDDLEEDDTRRSISARTGTQKRWAEEKRGWARRGDGRLGRSGQEGKKGEGKGFLFFFYVFNETI
jgi:hypothetical protein